MSEQPAHRGAKLVIVDGDELCCGDQARCHRARLEVRRQPVRDRVAHRHAHDVAGSDCGGDPSGLARLDAGEPHARARPGPQREPREEAASADRGDDGQLAGRLAVELAPDRGLPGDDKRVVVRRDERDPLRGAELQRVPLGGLIVRAVLDQLDRVGAKGLDLRS